MPSSTRFTTFMEAMLRQYVMVLLAFLLIWAPDSSAWAVSGGRMGGSFRRSTSSSQLGTSSYHPRSTSQPSIRSSASASRPSTSTYRPRSNTSTSRPSTKTSTYRPSTSTSAYQPSASTFQPSTSTYRPRRSRTVYYKENVESKPLSPAMRALLTLRRGLATFLLFASSIFFSNVKMNWCFLCTACQTNASVVGRTSEHYLRSRPL